MSSDVFQLNELLKPVSTGETRTEKWRRMQLSRLKSITEEHEEEILQALSADLGKPPTEAFFEVIAIRQELALTSKKLAKWMRPKAVNVPIFLQPGKARVQNEPLGCVLIIGPWNYPFMLTLQPLISALAAGNTAVLKPSEYAPATSNLIAKVIERHFPKDIVRVLEGDSDFSERLVANKFDHIFFTGGSKVGAKVMESAAKNLTPVTLELGGKNPAIILKDADIEITAKRLIWGKSINCGQTCLAPNHLLVDESIKESLIRYMGKAIEDFYGEYPLKSNSLGKMNARQFVKLKSLLQEANLNNKVILGGECDEQNQKISPALLEINSMSEPLMAEELFGPILPIKSISNLEDALLSIRNQPKPLAIYMFGGTEAQKQFLITTTNSGGVCFNDVVIQAAIPEMPFGGVGQSGMGSYHGYSGFENFSHKKAILERPFWLDINFRYPPYKIDISFIRKILN